MDSWVFITADGWSGALEAPRALGGRVTAVVVGSRELAESVAAAGPDEVRWVEPKPGVPPEAFSLPLADVVAAAAPAVLVAGADPAARALLGAAAAALEVPLLPGVVGLAVEDGHLRVRRALAGGQTIETCAPGGGVAVIYAGEDAPAATRPEATIEVLGLTCSPLAIGASEPVGQASGLSDAERVVSFGRGVRAREDVAIVQALADACGAELACSMPIADDLGWLDKSRYVGRSGNHIAPTLYLAVGIAGAPQHLEGVRGARIVAAINNDPDARIFQSADYGIVGDLYEVVPAVVAEIDKLDK
jgi:electron transfer flavoprotein alpha subunit